MYGQVKEKRIFTSKSQSHFLFNKNSKTDANKSSYNIKPFNIYSTNKKSMNNKLNISNFSINRKSKVCQRTITQTSLNKSRNSMSNSFFRNNKKNLIL